MTAPNSRLSIRKATQSDLQVIRDIAHQTWPAAYATILTPEALQYMLGYFYSIDALQQQMNEGQQFFIAEVNGKAVGFGAVSDVAPQVIKLNKLYVLPGVQKTGAGKALMEHAFTIAGKHNAKQVILNVNRYNPAKDFYQRLGFTIIKEEDVDLGNGVVQEDYVMGMAL
jgi:N-acetylglutamate synthase-like GNAT family acetyltransferase